jgi:hypothetical protein
LYQGYALNSVHKPLIHASVSLLLKHCISFIANSSEEKINQDAIERMAKNVTAKGYQHRVTETGFLSYASFAPETERASKLERLAGLIEQFGAPASSGTAKQLKLQEKLLFNDNEADIQLNYGSPGTNPSFNSFY